MPDPAWQKIYDAKLHELREQLSGSVPDDQLVARAQAHATAVCNAHARQRRQAGLRALAEHTNQREEDYRPLHGGNALARRGGDG